MPAWSAPELWLVWWPAISASASTIITRVPGLLVSNCQVVASPMMPLSPTMTSAGSLSEGESADLGFDASFTMTTHSALVLERVSPPAQSARADHRRRSHCGDCDRRLEQRPTPTLAQFEAQVAAGDASYYVVGSQGGASSSRASAIEAWVKGNFTGTMVSGSRAYALTK